MLYTHHFNGITVRTGDVLFTRDGTEKSVFGAIWTCFGYVISGDLDHCILYVGPGVRFIESAARGVVLIEMEGDDWDAERYAPERWIVDTLVAVADPTAGRGLTPEQEEQIRENVVAFCMEQVQEGKPYNLDFFDPETDGAFYCSQLVYKSYKEQGINLHSIDAGEDFIDKAVIFPKDIWKACLVRTRIVSPQAKQK